MKKFSEYVICESNVPKDKLTKIIGSLYDDLSSSFFGIKSIESDEYRDEIKVIKNDLKKLIDLVSNFYYANLKK